MPATHIQSNERCVIPVVVWLLCGEYWQNPTQWMIALCQHIGANVEDVTDVIGCGFAACCSLLSADERNKGGLHTLLKAEKALLACLAVDDEPVSDELRFVPQQLRLAEELSSGRGESTAQMLLERAVLPLMRSSWLNELADCERQFFFTEAELDAKAVGQLLDELMDALLPELLQLIGVDESMMIASAHALSHRDSESVSVWEAVTQSFINATDL